uniref:DUF4212 domain-containing protein n=1 Tax=Roseihalotalea indica TaxID=2867963 RepID=A0AA49GPA4_9BACT|nr:DUF4212 domain-containing protein [Tunicatimonas sp. TK19036]
MSQPTHSSPEEPAPSRNLQNYWKRNVRYLLILLCVWFIVSYGCGIIFAEQLNAIQIGGFKLGFWFAQQGSIYVFVILIFIYVWLMNRLDREFDVDEK